jgi:hypothetical protein
MRLLRRERRRQSEPIQVARDRGGNRRGIGEALDRALHVGRAADEAVDEIIGHARARAVAVCSDVGIGLGPRGGAVARRAEGLAHAAENLIARGAIAAQAAGHFMCPRTKVSMRSMPLRMASGEAA